MKCQFCNQELPENAKFCFKCKNQIVCNNCGELLLEGASICVFCGTEIEHGISYNASKNYIKYTEKKDEKSFEASFSDETATAVVDTLSSFIPMRKRFEVPENPVCVDMTEETQEIPTIPLPLPTNEAISATNENCQIDNVFKTRGDEVYLHETSLKASSKRDYSGRLTLLYLYYKKLHGEDDVKKSEVTRLLKSTGLSNDGSYRAWASQSKSLFNSDNNCYRLCRAGEERAKEYLHDVFNSEKKDGWKLGNSCKASSKTTCTNKRTETQTRTVPSIVKSLNLNPSGKESLRNFVSEYDVSCSPDYILLFVYYLDKIINEKNITINHIYTCYKDVSVKPPTNIRQCLFNTRNRKGTIGTSDLNSIKITTVGENRVEFDLKKK